MNELFNDERAGSEICEMFNNARSKAQDLDFLENIKNHYYSEAEKSLELRDQDWQDRAFYLFQLTTLLNVLYIERFDQDVAEKESFNKQFDAIQVLLFKNIRADLTRLFAKLVEAGLIMGSKEEFQASLESFISKNPALCMKQ